MKLERFKVQSEEKLPGKGKACYLIEINYGEVEERASFVPENCKGMDDVEYLTRSAGHFHFKPIADHAVKEHIIGKLRDLRASATTAYEALKGAVG